MTNQQLAADIAAKLVSLTNCKETDDIIKSYNIFYNNIIELLGFDNPAVNAIAASSFAATSPRNIPVVKSQEEMKMRLNDFTITSEGAVTAPMIQSSRPVKKDRPKKHPPKSKGPIDF